MWRSSWEGVKREQGRAWVAAVGGVAWTEMQLGSAPPRLKSSSRPPSALFYSASCRSTTGTCRRPRARCKCRGAICTRRSSGTVSLGGKGGGSGRQREGTGLGSRDARGGQAAREAARGGPHSRRRVPHRTTVAGRYAHRAHHPRRLWRDAQRRRDLGATRADSLARRGDVDVAVLARVRRATALLRHWRGHARRRWGVERVHLLEASPRLRAPSFYLSYHLGAGTRYGYRPLPHRLCRPTGRLVLSRTAQVNHD